MQKIKFEFKEVVLKLFFSFKGGIYLLADSFFNSQIYSKNKKTDLSYWEYSL